MNRDDLSPRIRGALVRLPPPHNNAYGVVPPAPPVTPIRLAGIEPRHLAAIEALARVEAYAKTLHDPYVVSRILTRQEAVSSSAIEGTNSTLDALLADEETHEGQAQGPTRQVRDYAAVLDAYVQQAGRQGSDVFDSRLPGLLHRRVMQNDPGYRDPPGKLRTVTVWIGGGDIAYSTYNPPPADKVEACLAANIDFMRADGPQVLQQSLLTRMAIAHAHFEAVHPFRDGNGRVGRLLLPMMMAAEGHTPLYLSAYIEANKAAYYAALKAAQQAEDWPAMIGFLCDAVVGSATELMRTREALTRLSEIWRARRAYRSGSSALKALAYLPQYPVVTVESLAGLLGVTFVAAARATDQLSEVGILRERTGYARNRIFSAPEALSILNRPFGAEPILPG